MNKIFLAILLTLLMATGTYASGIEFFEGTWAETKEKAKQENKLIFVDVYTDWCGPCKWMSTNTFPNEEVGKFYNENFISVRVNMEKEGDGVAFAKEYNIPAVPTLLYIDGKGELMHQFVGKLDPMSFISEGKVALDPERRLAAYEEKYKKGERDPEFIRAYIKVLSDASMNSNEVTDWYLFTQKEEALLSKDNFELIKKTANYVSSPQFQFVINHYDSYKKLVKAEEVDNYIGLMFKVALKLAALQGDEAYQQKINEIRAMSNTHAEKVIAEEGVDKSFNGEHYSDYVTKANEYLRTYEWDNAASLHNYATVVSQLEITDKKIIEAGISWIERAMELDNSYTYHYTHACLLYKVGKGKEALKAANTALEMAGNEEEDREKIVLLIQKIKEL
ncbi:thioredoxin family protein [Confluentibacter sediminis]|uniref:thioredoxin family protein n=1 Tax=Confluentibacter sediminis TaxID=2219045 RepID=UPI000DAE4102|nr:thioredoxin family protein [Confluentibacter sediminis]